MERLNIAEKNPRERNITVEEMRAIILARIEAGMNDPDPEKRAQWERIPRAGKLPTPEEWLRYAVERIKAEGRGDRCAGIRTFEYGCIDKKNGGTNTYTGVMIPLFFLY